MSLLLVVWMKSSVKWLPHEAVVSRTNEIPDRHLPPARLPENWLAHHYMRQLNNNTMYWMSVRYVTIGWYSTSNKSNVLNGSLIYLLQIWWHNFLFCVHLCTQQILILAPVIHGSLYGRMKIIEFMIWKEDVIMKEYLIDPRAYAEVT